MLGSTPSVHRLRTGDAGHNEPPRGSRGTARAPQQARASAADDEARLEEPLAVWLHLSWGIELG